MLTKMQSRECKSDLLQCTISLTRGWCSWWQHAMRGREGCTCHTWLIYESLTNWRERLQGVPLNIASSQGRTDQNAGQAKQA